MQDQTPASDRREVEWRFDVPDVRPVARWVEDHPYKVGPSVSAGGTREISDTYFGTGDWRIHRAGYALRVRSVGGGPGEATAKLLASSDGALRLRRREISEPLDGTESENLGGLPQRYARYVDSLGANPARFVRRSWAARRPVRRA